MQDNFDQFPLLIESVGSSLEGKDADIVVTVLALLLANASCMGGLNAEHVLSYVARVMRGVYAEVDHDDETIH
jgi:hypothetical protein